MKDELVGLRAGVGKPLSILSEKRSDEGRHGRVEAKLEEDFKDGEVRSMTNLGHGAHLRVLSGMLIWFHIHLMGLGAKRFSMSTIWI